MVDAASYLAAEAYLAGPAGCTLTIRTLLIGHAVTPDVVDELGRWFAAVRVTPDRTIGNS